MIIIYNIFHLGDNVFNIIALNKLKEYLKNENIYINYYLNIQYIYQIQEFIKSPNIILNDLKNKPKNQGFHMWIGNESFYYNIFSEKNDYYNEFYINYHNACLNHLKIPVEIKNITYEDETLLKIYDNLPLMYKNIDILILNSFPLSGQFDYNFNEWKNLCLLFLKNNINIVTSEKINNIKCTRDKKLTIKSIAAISINVKIVIAINSGLLPGLFNDLTLLNTLRFYVFDKKFKYSLEKFVNLTNLNFLPINEIINIVKKNT